MKTRKVKDVRHRMALPRTTAYMVNEYGQVVLVKAQTTKAQLVEQQIAEQKRKNK